MCHPYWVPSSASFEEAQSSSIYTSFDCRLMHFFYLQHTVSSSAHKTAIWKCRLNIDQHSAVSISIRIQTLDYTQSSVNRWSLFGTMIIRTQAMIALNDLKRKIYTQSEVMSSKENESWPLYICERKKKPQIRKTLYPAIRHNTLYTIICNWR